jgi:chromosome segregation ATPase
MNTQAERLHNLEQSLQLELEKRAKLEAEFNAFADAKMLLQTEVLKHSNRAKDLEVELKLVDAKLKEGMLILVYVGICFNTFEYVLLQLIYPNVMSSLL